MSQIVINFSTKNGLETSPPFAMKNIWWLESYGKYLVLDIDDVLYSYKFQQTPEYEILLKRVKDVSVSKFHALVLSHSNEVYSMGSDSHSETGQQWTEEIFKPLRRIFQPKLKIKPTDKVQVIAGINHSIIVCNDKIYRWGSGVNLSCTKYSVSLAQEMVNFCEKGIKKILSVYHTVVLTNDGELYGWGENINHQLHENGQWVKNIKKVSKKTFCDVAIECDKTWIKSSDGKVDLITNRVVEMKIVTKFTQIFVYPLVGYGAPYFGLDIDGKLKLVFENVIQDLDYAKLCKMDLQRYDLIKVERDTPINRKKWDDESTYLDDLIDGKDQVTRWSFVLKRKPEIQNGKFSMMNGDIALYF